MTNPEAPRAVVFAIAGQTSTGKTMLGEQIIADLRASRENACLLSVGDIFRLLSHHTEPYVYDAEALAQSARHTLDETHVETDPSGRIRLVYDGKHVEQTYHNGNMAAPLATNGSIIHQVNHFIHTHLLSGMHTTWSFVGLDGRERRDAHVLIRTSAQDSVRVAFRCREQPEACALLSDEQIRNDILARDLHEKPLVDALAKDDVNVIDVCRTKPDDNRQIVQKISGILVDFRRGNTPPNFGTLYLRG